MIDLSDPSTWLEMAKNLSPILGGAAKSLNDQQNTETNQQLSRDQINQRAYEQGILAPGQILSRSVAASKVANASPVKVNWKGPGSGLAGQTTSITGGYANPNLLSPDTRALANTMTHEALINHLSGSDRPPSATPQAPQSAGSKILGAGALASGILGALNKGQSGPTGAVNNADGAPSGSGTGASFGIPWSGFGGFKGSNGLPSYDPYGQNPDTGLPSAPQTLPGGTPSSSMDDYYAWLQAQQAPPGGNPTGNPDEYDLGNP